MVTSSKTALSNMPTTTLSEHDLVELLYQDKAGDLTIGAGLLDRYMQGCADIGQPAIFKVKELPDSIEEAVGLWSMPDRYKELDLDTYFAQRVNTVEEAVRVADELALFRERNMDVMLRFMIYLVDVMKENKIVWGVGRGSSVSSFLLFLVGLHQINPIKYNLDIREFIR
jgi:DNA polymerase III alpha subunit